MRDIEYYVAKNEELLRTVKLLEAKLAIAVKALEYIGAYNKMLFDLYDESVELGKCQNTAREALSEIEKL